MRPIFVCLLAILITGSARFCFAQDAPGCPPGYTLHPDKLRERGFKVSQLSASAQRHVIRYLQQTQGTPPNLSHWPGYTMWLSYQNAAAFVENGVYLTPPPSGSIGIIHKGCIVYVVRGEANRVIAITRGQWTLSTR